MKQSFSIKEALGSARSMVNAKMLAIVGIPLLILAVAVALLSVFRLTLYDKTLESRAEMMLSLAKEAFPDAEVTENTDNLSASSYFYTAGLDGEEIGTFAAVFDERGYAAIAFDANGAVIFEKTNLPDGPTLGQMLDDVHKLAILASP